MNTMKDVELLTFPPASSLELGLFHHRRFDA